MSEYRLIIAGSRDFTDYEKLSKEVSKIISNLDSDNITIISGEARGADILGKQFGNEKGFRVKKMPADWDQYGRSAGHRRNAEMAKYAVSDKSKGLLIAFWDGVSPGTKGMIKIAERYGMEVHVIDVEI